MSHSNALKAERKTSQDIIFKDELSLFHEQGVETPKHGHWFLKIMQDIGTGNHIKKDRRIRESSVGFPGKLCTVEMDV